MYIRIFFCGSHPWSNRGKKATKPAISSVLYLKIEGKHIGEQYNSEVQQKSSYTALRNECAVTISQDSSVQKWQQISRFNQHSQQKKFDPHCMDSLGKGGKQKANNFFYSKMAKFL